MSADDVSQSSPSPRERSVDPMPHTSAVLGSDLQTSFAADGWSPSDRPKSFTSLLWPAAALLLLALLGVIFLG